MEWLWTAAARNAPGAALPGPRHRSRLRSGMPAPVPSHGYKQQEGAGGKGWGSSAPAPASSAHRWDPRPVPLWPGTPGSHQQPQMNGTESEASSKHDPMGSTASRRGNPAGLGEMLLCSRFSFAPPVLRYLYPSLPAKTDSAHLSWVSRLLVLEEPGEAKREGRDGKAAPMQPAAHAPAGRDLLAQVHRWGLPSGQAPNHHSPWLGDTSCAGQQKGRGPEASEPPAPTNSSYSQEY